MEQSQDILNPAEADAVPLDSVVHIKPEGKEVSVLGTDTWTDGAFALQHYAHIGTTARAL